VDANDFHGTRILRITHGARISQITQIQEQRQPGVARRTRRVTREISTPADLDGVLISLVTRRVRAVGAAAVDFTIRAIPPVKMACAIREIRVP
jgi:hypothetical protein